jgi:hypothetical protein
MKRFPIVLLAVLFTAVVTAGSSFATEAPAPQVEPPQSEQVTQVQETCDLGLEQPIVLATTATEIDNDNTSPLDCNCNSNQDCKRICGDAGGTCFIGPVCNNWPDYTGKCMCSKEGEPQGL